MDKPKVEYSDFKRMLDEMRANNQSSAPNSNTDLSNNIRKLVIVTKELTKNISKIISNKANAPMGATPISAALQNSNNPKIQSDEAELEAIKREEEQTELLRIIAKNTGGKEKFKPEKPNEDVIGNGILKGLIMTGAAIVAFFKGYMTRFIKILTKTYELFVPESLRRGISESFAKIGTFFSEMVGKIKALFVFEEGSMMAKAINAIKTGFKSIGAAFEWIGEAVGKFGKFFDFLKVGKFAKFLKAVPIIGEIVAVVEAVWDTVSGIFEGWDKGGLIGAITGGLKGFFGKFLGGTLDLIKDIGSWIIGALGFKNLEKWIDSFSFEKAINGFIEAVMSPLQLLQDVIMHPIDSLKKLGGVISDVFSGIAKVFDPVIEFFSGIGKSVVGMLEGIGIPEIGFTIPVIGKKVSIGPFYPFKSDAQKPVAPEQGTTPAAKTAPEANATPVASTAPAAPAVKTSTKGDGKFNKSGFTPDGKIYEFKSEKEIDDAVESGRLFPEVADTRREMLSTKQAAAGMKSGETRTIIGGVPTESRAQPTNTSSVITTTSETQTTGQSLDPEQKAKDPLYQKIFKEELAKSPLNRSMAEKFADKRYLKEKSLQPTSNKSVVATPIPGGGQTVDPAAQNYNAAAAGTQVKTPERASPIVERKSAEPKIGPIWKEYLKDYQSSTPVDYLEGQYPGVGKKFLELAKKEPPAFDDYEVINTHEEMLVTKAIAEVQDKKSRGGNADQLKTRGSAANGLAPAASTGNIIEARTGAVSDTRENMVSRSNTGTAIVNAPTTVNNTSQTAQFAKSPFRNEEGTINRYYSTRFGAF